MIRYCIPYLFKQIKYYIQRKNIYREKKHVDWMAVHYNSIYEGMLLIFK